ncbi:hypothetical protein [Ectopseudomonas guguanensis]|uniref:Lipoprotein n=1 Tax=Ectopseudomonas guguanensis TaxID=1198456 RepID=A0A1H0TNV8_9GAMM|nr:hypothetical protein [Pseudomonas guguanensis]SDP55551.1 hypothetical protein SAMN05216213_104225 [Pseudomonas guguanensis]
MQGTIRSALAASCLIFISGCDQTPSQSAPALQQRISTLCALDAINGSQDLVVQSKTQTVDFRGWAVDSERKTVPGNLNLVLTNKQGHAYAFAHAQRNSRPDVVKAFNEASYLQSGYRVLADVSSLANDTYMISLQMPTEDSVITCRTRKVLLLKQ